MEADHYQSLGLSGGVANNLDLRARFDQLGEEFGMPALVAEPRHTGDNAAMIAFLAYLDPNGLVPNEGNQLDFIPSMKLSHLMS